MEGLFHIRLYLPVPIFLVPALIFLYKEPSMHIFLPNPGKIYQLSIYRYGVSRCRVNNEAPPI